MLHVISRFFRSIAHGLNAFGFRTFGLGFGKAVSCETSINSLNIPNLDAKSYPMLNMHLPMQPIRLKALVIASGYVPRIPVPLPSTQHPHAKFKTSFFIPQGSSYTRTHTHTYIHAFMQRPTPQNLAPSIQEPSTRAGGRSRAYPASSTGLHPKAQSQTLNPMLVLKPTSS